MKSIYTALLMGLSLVASAQNKVIGTISDKDNKTLAGINISMPELHKETISDTEGNYECSNLPNGTFKIVFLCIRS